MDGVIRVDRVAAQFEVWFDDSFPFAKIKVKILERTAGDYLAISNVAVRNYVSREPEWTSGIGDTIEEAKQDLLTRFIDEARQHVPPGGFTEADFIWSACEEF